MSMALFLLSVVIQASCSKFVLVKTFFLHLFLVVFNFSVYGKKAKRKPEESWSMKRKQGSTDNGCGW